MARFSGDVGYIENVKVGPGKWKSQETVRHYYGDVTRAVRRLSDGQSINDDIVVNNEISIVADPYAQTHFFAIRWVMWQGAKWKVTNAEALYPRIILSIGGLWNGKES